MTIAPTSPASASRTSTATDDRATAPGDTARREAPPREQTARRLLTASEQHSYDPLVDIDWDAPLLADTMFMPEHRVTLYGTPLWEQMSRQQRIDLSRHEVASIASVGTWFEVILMGLLSRHVYDEDLTSAHVHYAFAELADECRHSTMFGKLIDKLDCPSYGPGEKLHRLAKLMFVLPHGPSTWAAILVGEELVDQMQREAMRDESVQPIVRRVNEIHVVEEARHVRFAREELSRVVATTSPARMRFERLRTALVAMHVSGAFVHPRVYASVGLDVDEARRQVAQSPYRAATLQWSARRLVTFLRENDLIGGASEQIWRRARLL